MSAALSLEEPEFVWPPAAYMTKELDKVKSDVFRGSTASFFGPLLCSLQFIWDDTIDTACTNGTYIKWSPKYFFGLPPASRKADLMHELWHVALIHMVRRGNRDPWIWNIACDIKIDLMLLADGYTFEAIQGVLTWSWLDAKQYVGWVEEAIYDDLVAKNVKAPKPYQLDLKDLDPAQVAQLLSNVVQAQHAATMAGHAGHIPGNLESIINTFLAPVVPWERYVQNWMRDLLEDGYSYAKPNRRFMGSSVYMPGRYQEEGKLENLMYFEDVSGSISPADDLRFNSEIKYVWDVFQPDKLTLVQFDTRITQVRVFEKGDPYEKIQIIGRGGTSLAPVRDHIIEHQPTAAIVFSDLQCAPMAPLPFDIPILWVCIHGAGKTVPFGKLIHIR